MLRARTYYFALRRGRVELRSACNGECWLYTVGHGPALPATLLDGYSTSLLALRGSPLPRQGRAWLGP